MKMKKWMAAFAVIVLTMTFTACTQDEFESLTGTTEINLDAGSAMDPNGSANADSRGTMDPDGSANTDSRGTMDPDGQGG